MGRAIIPAASDSAVTAGGAGVYDLERDPAPQLRPVTQRTVVLVAPILRDTGSGSTYVRNLTGLDETLDRFDPLGLDTAGIRRLLARPWTGPVHVMGVSPANAVAADRDATAGTGTITITAKYDGAVGNSITAQFVAATNEEAAERNLVIRYDGTIVDTFENVAFDDDLSLLTSDYVTVSGSTPSAMPTVDASPVALTGGDDGGLTDSEITTALAAVGGFDGDIIAICNVPAANAANVLTAVNTWGASAASQYRVVVTPGHERWLTTRLLGATATEDGVPDTAYLIQRFDPWDAPVWTRSAGLTPWCVGLAVDGNASSAQSHVPSGGGSAGVVVPYGGRQLTEDAMGDLGDAYGYTVWDDIDGIGLTIREQYTQEVVSGAYETIQGYRYSSFLAETIATFKTAEIGFPAEIDMSTGRLTGTVRRTTDAIIGFLQGEATAGRLLGGLRTDGTTFPAYSVDPVGPNNQTDLDAGTFRTRVIARIVPAIRKSVLDRTFSSAARPSSI